MTGTGASGEPHRDGGMITTRAVETAEETGRGVTIGTGNGIVIVEESETDEVRVLGGSPSIVVGILGTSNVRS